MERFFSFSGVDISEVVSQALAEVLASIKQTVVRESSLVFFLVESCYSLDLKCLPKAIRPQPVALLGGGKSFKRWEEVGKSSLEVRL